MNLHIIGYMLGWVLKLEGLFLLAPSLTAAIYQESSLPSYLITVAICLVLGLAFTWKKPANTRMFAREGFVIVALAWVLVSMAGALPFYFSGEMPLYCDALFETVSGFTTTGASIMPNVETLSKASLLWRSITHWIGGMGVLVFMLAILPLGGGHTIHVMRAESPGPSVSKLSPHLRDTAMTLYGIYLGLTVLQIVLLLLGGMPLFDSINVAMSTAGTGGFGLYADSIAHYPSPYLQWVIGIFMMLFGVNFGMYFLLLVRKPKQVWRNEELRLYLGIIAASTAFITFYIRDLYDTFEQALRAAFFQVSSIITTTGFATADFNLWPSVTKFVLVFIMFIGACAGSTGGGIKVSRLLLLCKSVKKEVRYMLHPRSVKITKFEGRRVPHEMMRAVNIFLIVYLMVFTVSVFILTFDRFDVVTNFTAVAATLNNIGPGLRVVGPVGNFGQFSILSKLVLIFDMLAGRLELFPMLLLFLPRTWRRQ